MDENSFLKQGFWDHFVFLAGQQNTGLTKFSSIRTPGYLLNLIFGIDPDLMSSETLFTTPIAAQINALPLAVMLRIAFAQQHIKHVQMMVTGLECCGTSSAGLVLGGHPLTIFDSFLGL